MPKCERCGKMLSNNEIGINKKLINRNATKFLCKACLADSIGCDEKVIDKKIIQFKEMGCMLFA